MRLNHYDEELQAIRDDNRWRSLRHWPTSGGVINHDGIRYLNFSSNDYLDLANSAVLKGAVRESLDHCGCSATASRLMSGDLDIHRELEQTLATLTGHASALVFPSGYQTNVGVLTALAGRGDRIYSDALNHASIIDGARLSRADIEVYRHCDAGHLSALLEACPARGRRIIVTDAVFSMDGDLAPLADIAALAEQYNAILLVDEAHALGVWGNGGGLCREYGIKPDLITGTLGKALGSGGAFAAGEGTYYDLLVNKARSFIYSTGLTPMNAAAARAAASLLIDNESMGAELLERSAFFQDELADRGIPVVKSATQIVPIMVGDNRRVMAYADALFRQGLIVTGIRPPTVPKGTSRLRFSVTLAHSKEALEMAAEIVAGVVGG